MSLRIRKCHVLAISGCMLLTAATSTLAFCGTVFKLQSAALYMTAVEYATSVRAIQMIGGAGVGLGILMTVAVACVASHYEEHSVYIPNSPFWSVMVSGMMGFAMSVTAMLTASAMAKQLVIPSLDTMMANAYISSSVLAAVGLVCLIGAFALYRRERSEHGKSMSDILLGADNTIVNPGMAPTY